MVQEIEVRQVQVHELRATGSGAEQRIEGYAALFNTLSDDLGGFRESIQPGAFARTLGAYDQRALKNHNADYVLGRRKNNTLELSEDTTGLWFRATPPPTTWANDLLISIQRGDVDQMSFAFKPFGPQGDSWAQLESQIIRTLLDVDLFEISPVTFPAYPQTSASVRSKLSDLLKGSGQAAPAPLTPPLTLQGQHDLRLRMLKLAASV